MELGCLSEAVAELRAKATQFGHGWKAFNLNESLLSIEMVM
jgi:hypothetical protein